MVRTRCDESWGLRGGCAQPTLRSQEPSTALYAFRLIEDAPGVDVLLQRSRDADHNVRLLVFFLRLGTAEHGVEIASYFSTTHAVRGKLGIFRSACTTENSMQSTTLGNPLSYTRYSVYEYPPLRV